MASCRAVGLLFKIVVVSIACLGMLVEVGLPQQKENTKDECKIREYWSADENRLDFVNVTNSATIKSIGIIFKQETIEIPRNKKVAEVASEFGLTNKEVIDSLQKDIDKNKTEWVLGKQISSFGRISFNEKFAGVSYVTRIHAFKKKDLENETIGDLEPVETHSVVKVFDACGNQLLQLDDKGESPHVSNTGKTIVVTKVDVRYEQQDEDGERSIRIRLIYNIKGQFLGEVIHEGSVVFSDNDKYILFYDRKNTGLTDILVFNTNTRKVECCKNDAFGNNILENAKVIKIDEDTRKVTVEHKLKQYGAYDSFTF